TIDFKSFGVSLNFIPTVMASNHISLRVKPEVSQISSQGAITMGGLQIPALTVRRADTTIELGSGQSFVIAGLLQDNTSNDVQRYPGLGDLPVLGALFRSTSFQRNESELLIVVTPYIVRPIDDPKSIRYPTDAWQPATDIERVLIGVSSSPHLRGPAPGSPLPQSSNPPPRRAVRAADSRRRARGLRAQRRRNGHQHRPDAAGAAASRGPGPDAASRHRSAAERHRQPRAMGAHRPFPRRRGAGAARHRASDHRRGRVAAGDR